MEAAFKYDRPEQHAALLHLERDLRACIGGDGVSIYVEMTPAWGAEPIGDDEAAALVHDVNTLGNVDTLDLSETLISDKSADHLGSLKGVRQLFLGELVCTEKALSHISAIESLEYLSLSGRGITDIVFSYLGKLPRLNRLQLLDSGVSDAAVKRFMELRPCVSVDGR